MNTAMNKIFRICLALGCLAGIPALSAAQDGRKTCIDQGWKFHYGTVREAISPDFNDTSWRTLDLPHDWSVETEAAAQAGENIGPFSKNNPGGSATGQTVGGEGWYRKTFTLSAADEDKRISLYFEGVYAQSEVWVNGIKVYFNPYGYSSYRFDITDYCKPAGEENTVTVRAVNEGRNTRWYAGSGIYRHVWLMKTPEVYLDEWETAIVTDNLTDETAEISVTSTVFNASALSTELKAAVQLLTPDGRQMADADTVNLSLNAHDEGDAAWTLQVDAPQLWSPEAPRLYTARILLLDGEEATDQIDIPFGIRTLEFSAEKGFLLNGEPTKLKGGCVHHDHGLLGAASYDRAEERKAELLKSYGFNAVRCSHNIPAESFLDACDRVGLLVIDEAFDQWRIAKNPDDYARFFDKWYERDLTDMVVRDRNHPSIFMWSVGNEVLEQWSDAAADTLSLAEANMILNFGHSREQLAKEGEMSVNSLLTRRLVEIVKSLDSTRPVTAGCNEPDPANHLFRAGALDIIGFNYHEDWFAGVPEKFPGKPFLVTESVSGLGTRGYYRMPSDSMYIWPQGSGWCDPSYKCSSYDNCHVPWGSTQEETLRHVKFNDFI